MDVLSLAVPYEIDTLDPHVRSKLSNFAMNAQFYDALVSPRPDLSIEPCLAASWENPDLLTWIFHLRPSVRFHSGKPLRVQDVVYSLQRVLSHPEFETAPYVSNVADVQAISDRSVRIRTARPTAILLNKLCHIPIVPEGSTDEFLKSNEDGTGPYRLKSWKDGRVTMTRYEEYWGSKPEIREAVFLLGTSDEEGLEELRSGRCNFFQGSSKEAEDFVRDHARFQMDREDSIYLKYLALDLTREETPFCSLRPNPFQKLAVRQAIHMAINRDELSESLGNFTFPATQPVPPFTFGFNPSIAAPKRDIDRARRILDEVGVPDSFEATMHVRMLFRDAAVLIQQQLKEIGLQLRLEVIPDNAFFSNLREGQFTMYLSRFGSPTGDASDILESAFHSVDRSRHFGALNYMSYANQQLDAEIRESAEIHLIDRRKEKLQGIMSTLMTELVWLPLYVDKDVYVYDQSLQWEPRKDSVIRIAEIKLKRRL